MHSLSCIKVIMHYTKTLSSCFYALFHFKGTHTHTYTQSRNILLISTSHLISIVKPAAFHILVSFLALDLTVSAESFRLDQWDPCLFPHILFRSRNEVYSKFWQIDSKLSFQKVLLGCLKKGSFFSTTISEMR